MSGDFTLKDTMMPMTCHSKASTRVDGDPTIATGTSMTTGGVVDEVMMSAEEFDLIEFLASLLSFSLKMGEACEAVVAEPQGLPSMAHNVLPF
jgi:hypothetical protein